jgi:hypothetical protein
VPDVDPDKYDFDEDDVVVTHEKSHAAGVPAVLVLLRRGVEQMGAVRTARTLARLNQRNGFDAHCRIPRTGLRSTPQDAPPTRPRSSIS